MSNFTFTNVKISAISVTIPCKSYKFKTPLIQSINGDSDFMSLLDDFSSRSVTENQTTADLGFVAARSIMEKNNINNDQLAFIVFVSSTPDYRSPATATVLHNRLRLTEDCAAFDINSGGTGLIHSLQVGFSMLSSSNKEKGLIITGDTTSLLLKSGLKQKTYFGDGCAALVIEKCMNGERVNIMSVSNSKNFKSLINPSGGFRHIENSPMSHIQGFTDSSSDHLFIETETIKEFSKYSFINYFNFFLDRIKMRIEDYDLVICNHENESLKSYIAEVLPLSAKHPVFVQSIFGYKNGVTAPLILTTSKDFKNQKVIRTLLFTIGEGLSLGIADLNINTADILPIIESRECFTEGSVSHEM